MSTPADQVSDVIPRPEAEVVPEPAADVMPVPEAEVIPEPGVDDEDEVFPSSGAGSRAGRAGVLVGAVVGLVLVASVAFAASTVRPPAEPTGAQDRPSETSLPTRAGGTPVPQLTTLPFPGDAPRNSGTPAEDDGRSPDSNDHSSSSPSGPSDTPTVPEGPSSDPSTDPAGPSDPPSTDPTEPTSDPSSTEPSDPGADPPPIDCLIVFCDTGQ